MYFLMYRFNLRHFVGIYKIIRYIYIYKVIYIYRHTDPVELDLRLEIKEKL